MSYIQINCVIYPELTDQQIQWLNEQDDTKFVFISDGDESLIRDFDQIALSIDEVLADISDNERITLAVELNHPLVGTSLNRVKSYYHDEFTYEYMATPIDE